MGKVFKFTFIQNTKGKGFVFITFILPLIICGIIVFADIIAASGEASDDVCPIEKIYVTNNSELKYMDFDYFGQYADETYSGIQFITTGNASENELRALDMTIEENDKEYSVNIHIPEWSDITYSEAKDFNNNVTGYIEQLKTVDDVMRSDKNIAGEADIMKALIPVSVKYTTIGDDDVGLGAELLKMFLPLLIVLVLYFIVLMYGQSIGKIIIAEKVSRLMETLLLNVRPYQLISGKILAVVAIASLQIVMLFLGIIAGLNIGNMCAKSINPEFSNVIFSAMELISDGASGMAFSLPSVLLGIVAVIIGFIFYCVLAALIASPVSKADELASSTGIYQTFVIIAFLLAYMLPFNGSLSSALDITLHIVPFTSSFMLAGDIIIGNISIAAGAGYLVLLAIFTAGLALYAGRLYRNQVFYYSSSGSFVKRLFS